MQKAIDIADRVVSLVEDGLHSLDVIVRGWPPEFRAIVWDAVANVASRRAETARRGIQQLKPTEKP